LPRCFVELAVDRDRPIPPRGDYCRSLLVRADGSGHWRLGLAERREQREHEETHCWTLSMNHLLHLMEIGRETAYLRNTFAMSVK
jgi:hypothetical protein